MRCHRRPTRSWGSGGSGPAAAAPAVPSDRKAWSRNKHIPTHRNEITVRGRYEWCRAHGTPISSPLHAERTELQTLAPVEWINRPIEAGDVVVAPEIVPEDCAQWSLASHIAILSNSHPVVEHKIAIQAPCVEPGRERRQQDCSKRGSVDCASVDRHNVWRPYYLRICTQVRRLDGRILAFFF